MAEIKTTKELKREIEKIRYITGANYQKYIRKSYVVDLINSFEAWVRKRIGELEKETKVSIYGMILAANPGEVRELRRLLEGEGGEKKG